MFLFAILVVAFLVRLAWRIYKGSADFWANGCLPCFDLASNLAAGHGLHVEGAGWALKMPAYPAFLALASMAGKSYLWIVIPQALIGAGVVLCAYLIGRELFGKSAGVLASLLAAGYPYYVVHDTALEETGMFTFLTALAVFLLLRARRSSTVIGWTMAGLALGVATLTRQTLAPFAVLALVWIVLWGERNPGRKLDRLIAVAAPLCLLVGLWMARNYMMVGSPVLTSAFGRQLWNANNPNAFTHDPEESKDGGAEAAFAALTPGQRQDLDGMADEVLKSDWFENLALAYMSAHPLDTLRGAGRRILAGFSWRLHPGQEQLAPLVYLISYGPIAILGLLGMVVARRDWKNHTLVYALFLAFAAVTAVLTAHTCDRSYLDVYWIVFAAGLLDRVFRERFRKIQA